MMIEVTIKARAAVKTRQISALLHFVHPQIDDFCIAFRCELKCYDHQNAIGVEHSFRNLHAESGSPTKTAKRT